MCLSFFFLKISPTLTITLLSHPVQCLVVLLLSYTLLLFWACPNTRVYCILLLSQQHILQAPSTFVLNFDPDAEIGLMTGFQFHLVGSDFQSLALQP